MREIVNHVSLDTEGAGITFSLPVSDVEGIKQFPVPEED